MSTLDTSKFIYVMKDLRKVVPPNREILKGIWLSFYPGAKIGVVGGNGSGKSTLLRSLSRLLAPHAGAVLLDGADLHRLPTKAVAQKLAILPQGPSAPEGLTVEELAWFGRHPHQGLFASRTAEDRRIVAWALDQTGMTVFASRPLESLSGGQRQRAWIAMVLAQDSDILLLDEPTTYLDVAHQVEVLDLVRSLNREEGRTVVVVLHDLNQAVRYADHLVVMREGRIVAAGDPADIVTAALVADVFALGAVVVDDPVTGGPLVVPHAHWVPARP